MSARAVVTRVDPFARMLDLWFGDVNEQIRVQSFGGHKSPEIHQATEFGPPDPEPSMRIREDEALALLAALHAHFGGLEDTRSLRRDYDAERARSDKLTDALIDTTGVLARGKR